MKTAEAIIIKHTGARYWESWDLWKKEAVIKAMEEYRLQSHPSPTKTAIECWKSAGNNPDNYSQSVKEAMEEYLQQYTTSHASHLTSSVEIIAEKHADKLYDKNAKTQIMVMECDLWHLRKNNFKDGVLSSSHPSPMSAEPTVQQLRDAAKNNPDTFLAGALYVIDNYKLNSHPMSAEQVEELGEKYADSKYDKAIHLIGWSNTKHGFIAGHNTATTPSVKADGWVSVEDGLPEPLETVWLSNGKGFTSLGCRTELVDVGDDTYNWCWAQSNGIIYEEKGKIVSECEDDDLDVKFWQPLPAPPKQKL